MKLDNRTYAKVLARETARMSYPGRMGTLLGKGAKAKMVAYFECQFPMQRLMKNPRNVAASFDKWHRSRTDELGSVLDSKLLKRRYRSEAVAAKLMNTFHHQLMKYGRFRPLYRHLHLPLDQIVFRELRSLARRAKPQALSSVLPLLRRNPYMLKYDEYLKIQNALARLLVELPVKGHRFTSRIELNALLWAARGQQADRRSLAAETSYWSLVAGHRSLLSLRRRNEG